MLVFLLKAPLSSAGVGSRVFNIKFSPKSINWSWLGILYERFRSFKANDDVEDEVDNNNSFELGTKLRSYFIYFMFFFSNISLLESF